ncbi:hypothetical protein TL16_g10050 [Triparma laevis f. inornata]|uniref:Coatomer subunit epsilon n=2 Tax=Triparma laevis TaxID=1534972 RepID=A0A9W7AB65_9STRA|nr:hypothetical protein TrLO_g10651 [Triparma laevis f. longispina]GMH84862.1 hypothetical protein TL16_g10050 [Triparma laevis f. inornata]
MADNLYQLKALYVLGHYQLALDESSRLPRNLPPPETSECTLIKLLSTLALNASAALPTSTLESTFATLIQNAVTGKEDGVDLEEVEGAAEWDHLKVALATYYSLKHNLKDALRILSATTSLASHLLTLQLYLSYDRPDLSKKSLQKIQTNDEDSVEFLLGSALLNLYNNEPDEAVYSLSTLSDQYGRSPKILNLLLSAYYIKGETERCKEIVEEIEEEGGVCENKEAVRARVGGGGEWGEEVERAFERCKNKF